MEGVTLQRIRQALLALVAVGTVGMLVELIVLDHFDDANQLIPLAVGGAGLLAVAWAAVTPTVVALRTLQFMMLVFVGTAIIGMTLHSQATDVEAPALAPGLLAQLGFAGLLSTYDHPSLKE